MDNPDKAGKVNMTNQTPESEASKSESTGDETRKLITYSDSTTMRAVLDNLTDSRGNSSRAKEKITKTRKKSQKIWRPSK